MQQPLQAVLAESQQPPPDLPTIQGWDFNRGNDLDGILGAMLNTGCQATSLGQAINEVNRMVSSQRYFQMLPHVVCASSQAIWLQPQS